jgi:type II secretory pathway pseudopilin PulG
MNARSSASTSPARDEAFTLIELLVVIGVLVLGALMLAPALARTRTNTPALQCMNNARQIAAGWIMYSHDNNGALAPNRDGAGAGLAASTPAWVAGWLDFSSRTDNTNAAMLVNHDAYPYGAYLGPYVGRNAAVFKCPADHSTAPMPGGSKPRVRSISMNSFVGTGSRVYDTPSAKYTVCANMSQVRLPAGMFVTLDEHPDGINDGSFFTDPGILYQLVDYPAAYHARGCCFSFADGHSAIHKWLNPLTCPPIEQGAVLALNVNLPGDQDVSWLDQHAIGAPSYP